MENVVLTVHLILAVLLIGVVLLQRSEGGGLGLGGGGGSGVMTGRQAANALSRATWMLAAGFIVTSLALTVIAARDAVGGSVMDRIGGAPATEGPATGLPQLPAYAPPPPAGQPVLPPGQPVLPPGAAGTPAPAAATAPAAAGTDTPAAPADVPPADPVPAPAADPAPAATESSATGGGTTTTTTVPLNAPAPAGD